MQDYKSLEVWKKAHKLTLDVYKTTAFFPKEEIFGVTSQIRRAAVSTPSNIVEGCGRLTPKDFCNFLRIGYGSSNEVDYLLLLSYHLNYLNEGLYHALDSQNIEVKKMLAGLMKSINKSKW